MKWVVPILGAVLAGGCVSSAGTKLSEEDKAICRGENPSVVMIGMASCMEYGRVKRMRGVWYVGPEESRFVAGDTRINREPDKNDLPSYDPWLLVDVEAVFGRIGNPRRIPGCARAVYLEFDGRESIRHVPGSRRSVYGHPVLFSGIMVEQVRAAKFLGYVRAMNTELQVDCSETG